jgi:subtilisin family serine protease
LKWLLAPFVVALNLTGCYAEVDNQRLAPETVKTKINPHPLVQNPSESNKRHQVLIAVLDSGVDYNHPVLRESIHYDLDEKGKAVGAGWDFPGDDPWPAPYLARTYDLDPEAPKVVRERSALIRKKLAAILEFEPSLASKIDPERRVEVESRLFHGTHVAALAASDEPRIGILPFTAMVVNSHFNSGASASLTTFREVFGQVLAAIEMSVAKGARVVNMSLGFTAHAARDDVKAYFPVARDALKKLIAAHPEVVFVAASGNESTNDLRVVESDGDHLPCGLPLANLLCVTAGDESGQRAEFSNPVASGLRQIMALGVNLISAFPTQACASGRLANWIMVQKEDSFEELRASARELKSDCSKPSFIRESGTSMATPLVSREAAKILLAKPELSGSQVIDELLKSYRSGFVKPKPPTWAPPTASDAAFESK